MSNISTTNGSFSRCNDERNVQQHMNENREDFSDNSKWIVRVIRNFIENNSSLLLENSFFVISGFNQTFDSWNASACVVLKSQVFHPKDLSFWDVAREV